METKNCKYCYSMIPKWSKICPNCKRKVKSRKLLILALIILAFFIYVFISATKDTFVTIDEYNQIETGMTYNQVTDIFDAYGRLESSVEMSRLKSETYIWYNPDGSFIMITFHNGKVSSKSRHGGL